MGFFGTCTCNIICLFLSEKQLLWERLKFGDSPSKNLVVRSKSYNMPMLTPVAEYETEAVSLSSSSIRRHSVCQINLHQEEPAFSTTSSSETDTTSQFSASHCSGEQARSCRKEHIADTSPISCLSVSSLISTACCSQTLGTMTPIDHKILLPSGSSSPEMVVEQVLESLDSDGEGIFIDLIDHSSHSNFNCQDESVV